MPSSRGAFVVFLLGLGSLAAARASSAQTYGLGDQVLSIGATSFQSALPISIAPFDGYALSGDVMRTPVPLPDGAEIFKMCIYAKRQDVTSVASARLVAFKLVSGGPDFGAVVIPDSFVTATELGYSVTCSGPLSFVYLETRDVDGDFFTEHISLVVEANTGFSGRIGGVRIFWRRKVSDPFGPTFNDVPASDSAYPFVEALALSGITAGCGGGNFCPDAPLTRRQMAVFLSKALGLHWLSTLTP